jgi:ankyrin repeat protein
MSTPSPAPIRRKDQDFTSGHGSTDATNRTEWSALHLAAFSGDALGVIHLLSSGARVNERSIHDDGCTGATALHCAAVAGAAEVVRILLAAGADPRARDEAGYTALHIAAERGDGPVLKALAKGGADPKAEIGDTSALALARRGRHQGAVGLLRQLGAK